jgi:nucleoid DNA-binding protein
MNPKKCSTLFKELSEDLNLPKELIEDLIQNYYEEVRNNLTNLTNPRINVEGLGQFVARPVLIKSSIERYRKALISHDTSTYKAYYNKKMLTDKLKALETLHEKLNIIKSEKEIFKNKNNEECT